MISGGLAGGSTQSEVDWAFLAEIGFAIADTIAAMMMICQSVTAIMSGAVFIGGVGVILGVVCIAFATYAQIQTLNLMCAYMDGDDEAGKQLINNMWTTIAVTIGTTALVAIAGPVIKQVLKNKLFREYGQNLIEKLQKSWGEIIPVGKKIQSLKNMYVGSGAIKTAGEKFGAGGLDWILGKKHLEIPGGIWNKLVKADGLLNYSDDLLKAIKNSKGYADDIIEIVEKYGDDAADAVVKYGDDIVPVVKKYGKESLDVIKKYGETAVELFMDGYEPDEVGNLLGGATSKTQQYIEEIVDAAGNVNTTKMNELRLAIQNGTFTADEIKEISKQMSDLGITDAFEAAMKEIDFGKYLRTIAGDPPTDMVNPHEHHILFKTGNGTAQKQLVKEGQEILRKHGIDPIIGEENLVWAPNGVVGQHDVNALREVVETLKAVDGMGGDYDDIVAVLREFGDVASQR